MLYTYFFYLTEVQKYTEILIFLHSETIGLILCHRLCVGNTVLNILCTALKSDFFFGKRLSVLKKTGENVFMSQIPPVRITR